MNSSSAPEHTLILGGTSGIGLDVARRLADDGRRVTLVGRRRDKLDAAVRSLSDAAGSAHGVVTDLRDPDSVDQLLSHVGSVEPAFDGLVHSAGTFFPKPFLEHEVADFDAYHDLNRAGFRVTQAFALRLVGDGRPGAIVNVGSMWAHQAVAATPSSAYSMAKAGLHALTQHLAIELGGHGIRANAVAP